MTAITIRKTENGIYQGFNCIGHAGWNRRGKDIVCAAVSILAINTVNAMQRLGGETLKLVQNEKEGLLDVSFEALPNDKSVLLMDAMVLGLSQIAEEYGKKYIELKFEEV